MSERKIQDFYFRGGKMIDKKYYIVYYFQGVFSGDTTTHDIISPKEFKNHPWPKHAYAKRLYSQDSIKHNNKVFMAESEPESISSITSPRVGNGAGAKPALHKARACCGCNSSSLLHLVM